MSLLVCGFVTLAVLVYVFYLPGVLRLGPTKTRVTYLRERTRRSLRKPARSEFRIQSRKVVRSRLQLPQDRTRRRSGRHPRRNRPP